MKVSIVIPAYNEEKRINKTLPVFIKYSKEFANKYNVEIEIIVVNDGSKDNMMEILKNYEGDIKIVTYSPNMGKGYALREGIKNAQGDYIYIADVDLSTPIEYIDNFFNQMNGYDCVIGSRALEGGNINESVLRKSFGKMSNLLIRMVLGLNFKDTQCGFKMFNLEAKRYFLMCENNRFGFDFEFLYLLKKNGLKIKEIPVKWDEVGQSTVKPSAYYKTFLELFNVRRIHG